MNKFVKLSILLILAVFFIVACGADNIEQGQGDEKNSVTQIEADVVNKEENVPDQKSSELSEADQRILAWAEDLDQFKLEIMKNQEDLKEYYTEEEFIGLIEDLKARTSVLSDEEIALELRKILASLNDAHTRLILPDSLVENVLPLKLTYIDGHVYCVNVTQGYEEVLLKKIVKIDGTDINYIINKLSELGSSENEYGRRYSALTSIRFGNILNTLNLTESKSKVNVTYEAFKNGATETVEVAYVPLKDYFNQKFIMEAPINNNVSALDVQFEKSAWYDYIDEDKVLILSVTRWKEDKRGDFKKLYEELWDFIDNNDVEKFVLDVRYNHGGYTEFVDLFLKGATLRADLFNPESFFVFTGNYTNSCGVISAAQMAHEGLATVVGEPTKGAPNTRYSGKNFYLKNIDIHILLSGSGKERFPSYDYETLMPHVFMSAELEDYKNQNDPLLEYVINY